MCNVDTFLKTAVDETSHVWEVFREELTHRVGCSSWKKVHTYLTFGKGARDQFSFCSVYGPEYVDR